MKRLEVIGVYITLGLFRYAAGSGRFFGEKQLAGILGKKILGSFAVLKDIMFIIVDRKVINFLIKAVQFYFASHPIGKVHSVPRFPVMDVPGVNPYFAAKRNFSEGQGFHIPRILPGSGVRVQPAPRKCYKASKCTAGRSIQTMGPAIENKGRLKPFERFLGPSPEPLFPRF
jgi:hypothetical protein